MILRKAANKLGYTALILAVLFIGSQLGACQVLSTGVEGTSITVQFNNYHGSEFAGFYIADQDQYYAGSNLQVTFVPGDLAANPIDAVSSGAAQFGITSADNLLRAKSQGIDVVAIAAIYRLNPLSVITSPEMGIRTPSDLVGKKVGIASANLNAPRDQQFIMMLKYMDIDPTSVQFIQVMDFHGIGDLTIGRVNAISGFSGTQQMVQARYNTVPLEQIFYSDYGIPFYPNVLFTTQRLIAENPNLVQHFVQDTLRGYRYAFEHIGEAGDIIAGYDSRLDAQGEASDLSAQIPLIDTGDAPIGWMDTPIWQTTLDILLEQEIISAPLDLEEVFTNQFVENSQ
jgi:NitT/TauT family transport system substrate-binding protein